MSRASTRSEPGGLATALSFWSVRALLVVFATGTLVGVLSLAEGARLRTEITVLEGNRRIQRLLDDGEEAIRALERRLETAGPAAPADSWALEVRAVRERLKALQAGVLPGARFPERPLLEEVARIEAAGRQRGGSAPSPAGSQELRDALDQRWSVFHEAVHEELTREEAARLWRIGERSREHRSVLFFIGLAATAVVGVAIAAAGRSAMRAAEQARALVAGDFAGAAAPGVNHGDCAGLRAAIGAAAVALSAAESRRRDEQLRVERFFQRMESALADIADGQRMRQLPPAEEPACAGAVAALGRVVERLRAVEEREELERYRTQSQTAVPREEI